MKNEMNTRQMNNWLKKNLPVFARVCEARIGQFVIGADASVNLHAMAEEIKTKLGAREVLAYGVQNYLTINL
jgi:hypothetical protein